METTRRKAKRLLISSKSQTTTNVFLFYTSCHMSHKHATTYKNLKLVAFYKKKQKLI